MKMSVRAVASVVAVLLAAGEALADDFGTGANQFSINFVAISGDTNPASGYGIVSNDYRMGIHEITNAQWDKFKESLGVPVRGDPSSAYDGDPYWIGASIPTNQVSWCEAAQFVNWLNTSTDHQAAYKFTGVQGESTYAFDIWSTAEADNGTNLYRHKDAMYYLPTEDEWVKAAYWNGKALQTYATKAGESLHQGDGVSGTGWNYYDNGAATDPIGPWDVGSGSEELNGTFDMMGNVWDWMENPYADPLYGTGSSRGQRGGSYAYDGSPLPSSARFAGDPYIENRTRGFRVASEIPEPATLTVLALGGLAVLRRRRS